MAGQKLTPEYVKRVREIFDVFDIEHNENDEMSIDHMGLIIRAFGQIPSEEEVQEIIDEVDADGNRRLLFSELLDLLAGLPPNERGSREELEQAFEIFKEREVRLI
ncbi:hypothetical protein HELRODRAFT_164765 [Helobdella robusta]|uniref:EF-hand domain-containing protein n=1 Tax=Helobdella robusta TaxID=6412 RepID=T1EVS4_HELRO|nr:hypothetical protein HELRODRAFT_164765 [Helobdella robusta]ESN92679.1 hypothetical protein HELRODRAFT_164765 [Helobdella robusta]